ncbi:MAG: L-seryl-tRNA(Sec) selenium transferase [Actinomycetota bacterium]|nr:L-seryl-tRNA(Sec) selenium transferase [Actinomycetota bacterium]
MDPRRGLPSVERVLASLSEDLPHEVRAEIARDSVAAARALVERGVERDVDAVLADATARADAFRLRELGPVVNATGVLLHTNLGRAPIGDDTLTAMRGAAGYANLEYRLAEGVRGSRHEHAGHLLATACGAEAGIVVNNNAAAVLLVLATLARGREVIVSRGELVEIGGGFRVPEILAETGARLVEVGTTNRTRYADYERAHTESTAIALKVHASNYRMIGFVESTPIDELARLGPPVVVDVGSGLLDEATPWLAARPAWLHDEPGVRQCLTSGAALVTFSGDKLLGGPQAGVIVGRRDLIDRCKAHPLARALRADKLTLAGLQHVARAYLANDAGAIPFWRLATTPVDALRARAEAIARVVPNAKVEDTEAVAGGGSLPGLGIPSVGVSVEVNPAEPAAARLRAARIVARVEKGRIVCDLRTVEPDADARLAASLASL